METFAANICNCARREFVGGKEYYSVPTVLIVEGVLAGSQGALMYPKNEFCRTSKSWNGVPLVVNHPADFNGRVMSASDPGVYERSGIGHVRNARCEGNRLVAEAMVDVAAARRIDARIVRALERGDRLEVSTGLYTANEETPGRFNGRAYRAVARRHRPDHLAVLVDSIGACSTRDGCGLGLNYEEVLANLDIDFLREHVAPAGFKSFAEDVLPNPYGET